MLRRISVWFRFHLCGLVVSVVIGGIIAAPPIIFHFSKEYRGVDMLKTNTEAHYVAQIQEVYDGHAWLGNPFFADLKAEPYLFPILSPNIVAWIGKLLGLSAIGAVLLTRFLFTTLLAFMVYRFSTELTGRRIVGCVTAPFVLLGYSLVNPAHIIDLFRQGRWSQEKTFIDYGRPINPQLSSLFFFSYLFCLTAYLKNTGKKVYAIIAGGLLGLSFYAYLFTWTFLFTLNAGLVVVYTIKKDWQRVKGIVLLSVGAGLVGIPYFLHTITVSRHPWYAESAPRFGFVHTRTPNLSQLVFGAFVLFLCIRKRLSEYVRLFFWAFFPVAIFVVNEQVLTGLFVFNHHYHWYYNTPLVIIFFVIALLVLLGKLRISQKLRTGIMGLLLCVCVYNGVATQIISYQTVLPEVKNEQRYAPLFSWLKEQAPRDSTVLVSENISTMIPALTHNNVYYHGTAIYTLVPDKRLLHAYLVYRYLEGVPQATVADYLADHRAAIAGFVFGYTYSFQRGVCPSCFPDNVIAQLTQEYQTLSDVNFMDYIQQYPVDYLIWDKKSDPEWKLDRFGLTPVKTQDDFVIYRVPAASKN